MASIFSARKLLKVCLASASTTASAATPPKPFSELPGPAPVPFLGNALQIRKRQSSLREYINDGFREYGDIYKLDIYGNKVVLIKDPYSIEKILRTEGRYPQRDALLADGMNWLIKHRLKQPVTFAFLNGDQWRRLRTAVGMQGTPKCVHMHSGAFNTIFKQFVDYIRTTRGERNTIADITFPLKLLFLQLSAKLVFSHNVDALNGSYIGHHQELIEAIDGLFAIVVLGAAEREMERADESGTAAGPPGLLEQWLKEGKLTKEQALMEAASMFAAGVDSSASQAAFLLHHLSKDPEVQERLHQEVRRVLRHSKEASPQQLGEMPYLKGCLLESFRMGGTANSISRVTHVDRVIHGYSIPAQTLVIYSMYAAGRDERLFPAPHKFDPERWTKDDKSLLFAIQPFGFGPRACYGRRFVEMGLRQLVVQLVSNFEMSTSKDQLKTVKKGSVVPGEALPVTFLDR